MEQANTPPKGVKIGYILDRHGRTFSKSACDYVQLMAARDDPAYKTGPGVLFMFGPEYADPAVLAGAIEARKLDSMVAVYDEDMDAMATCKLGPGPDGIDAVLDVLRDAERRGVTSWEALHGTIRWKTEK